MPATNRLILLGLYEHSVMAPLVREMCDTVSRNVPRTVSTLFHVWEFSALQNPAIQQLATGYGTNSGLILLAAEGGPLPAEVKKLLDRILIGGSVRGLAVTIHRSSSSKHDDMPALASLARMALHAGISFHISGHDVPGAPGDESFERWVQHLFDTNVDEEEPSEE